MLIWDWNPTDAVMWSLLARNQLYRCSVDGDKEFQGEILPIGTEENVLAWIKARYKVVGELLLLDMDIPRYNIVFSACGDPESLSFSPMVKRYLVEVDGKEKVFTLTPLPDKSPYGLLTCQKREVPSATKSQNMV
ncbi:MAG: hypothetical protein IKQ17_11575 [Kiritimatiellae bacterium]|nr:hypothetical protein [Kiritimatiellia bacterium]